MKEERIVPEKTIVIDLRLSRGLVVALSCVLVLVALLTVLTLTGDSASASEIEAAPAASVGMRQYYLTPSSGYSGNQTLDACVDGYHMASLWELTDPSGLKYDTDEGLEFGDSGEGPAVGLGWVRTGFADSVLNTAGQGNCDGWESVDGADYGSVVKLPSNWTGGTADVSVWEASAWPCDSDMYVWCIED